MQNSLPSLLSAQVSQAEVCQASTKAVEATLEERQLRDKLAPFASLPPSLEQAAGHAEALRLQVHQHQRLLRRKLGTTCRGARCETQGSHPGPHSYVDGRFANRWELSPRYVDQS